MKKKRIIAIILALVICTSVFKCNITVVCGEEVDENSLYSISAVLIDGDTGRVLYEKNGYEVRPMASTTKIMTLIVALEYGNPDDLVTVSSYASKMPDVQLGIREGEQYLLEDLLYSLILESHNDVAVAIAEHVGGSVEDFADMMNNKAKEIGLSDTYFITPNGLDAADENGVHSTNAVELALIMRYCIMDSPMKEEFIKICQTRQYSFMDYEETRNHTVYNKNAFLDMMDGVIAGKTGFTADAGYCYTAAIENEGKTYIVALLGCGWPNNKNYKWKDTRTLFNYGIMNYSYKTVLSSENYSGTIQIENGIDESYVDLYINESITLILSEDDELSITYNLPDKLKAPVSKNQIIGNINIAVNGKAIKTINIYSMEEVRKKDYSYYIQQVFFGFLM